MKAITVQYHGPGENRAAYYEAQTDGRRVRVPASLGDNVPSLTSEHRHRLAAIALAQRLDWTGTMAGGSDFKGCWVYVFVPDATPIDYGDPSCTVFKIPAAPYLHPSLPAWPPYRKDCVAHD